MRSLVALFLTLFFVALTREARADLLLTPPRTPLTSLGVRNAIAVTGPTTTRWSRITFAGIERAMWLVPTRSGATLDWADGWFEELDALTAPRVQTCTSGVQTMESFEPMGTVRPAETMTIPETEAALNDLAALRGFAVSTTTADQIHAAWERGTRFAVFELAARGASIVASPTIRVRDDGGAFPLAPAIRDVDVRWTLFTLTPAPVTIAGAGEVDRASDFLAVRAQKLGASGWVRDASVARTTPAECTCAAGALVGATTCPAACSDAALAGTSNGFVSRFSGLSPRATPAGAPSFQPALPRSPMLFGESCVPTMPPLQPPPASQPAPPDAPLAPAYVPVRSGESCGSDPAYGEAASEGCALLVAAAGDQGGGGENEGEGEGEGESDDGGQSDESDDTPDTGGGGGDSDDAEESTGGDDSTDIDTESIPLNVKPKKLTRKTTSPVSRMALLLGALALPLRRRRRPAS